ncbi:hypothetical protein EV368DRAFT_47663 [Lentinula lateritia]|uniref:Uncharacterized protein n=1 Tax=Lentinula aff. lateritia TaxID=2804960 RepID=A0ACC1TMA0_9AGAR|nr:hypothetical protein F5876DRAFT_51231 [Lentinula aff. lateritia]KAJ3849258.1 hypothetical protein EV368DRAFT_47663 [Lentinula lateritia]
MTQHKPPNPFLLIGLSLGSFVLFYSLAKYREKTNPASSLPRQLDHPLVPPSRPRDN